MIIVSRMPLTNVPFWLVEVVQTKASLERISAFLDEPEVDDEISSLKRQDFHASNSSSEAAPLGFLDGSFRWNSTEGNSTFGEIERERRLPATPSLTEQNSSSIDFHTAEAVRFELQNISVIFPQGKLTVVTGPTASGKTALLVSIPFLLNRELIWVQHGLLGEMTKTNGRLLLDKEPLKQTSLGYRQGVSFAAQTPWLQHASIQNNILFGQSMEADRYKNVLDACALKPDLAIFEDGDQTEIGAR